MSHDLTFGTRRPVVVVDGASAYRPIDLPQRPELEIHWRGSWATDGEGGVAGQILEALEADDWTRRDGRFSLLCHHRPRRRLTVISDRFSFLPIYRCQGPDGHVLATTQHALAHRGLVDGSWDMEALSEILAFNFPLDGKTLMAGVRALGTAQCWEFDLEDGGFEERSTWRPASLLAGPRQPFEALQEELVEHFEGGVASLLQGHEQVGTTLSGGIDSRCLLAAAQRLNPQLSAYHVSVEGSRSEVYARRIAAMRQLPLTVLSVGEDFAAGYFDKLRNIVRLSEGMSFNSEAEGHFLRDHVDGPSVILHGGFAELSKMADLRRYHVGEGLLAQSASAVASYLWPRWQRRFENRLQVLAPELRRAVEAPARANFESLCQGIAASHPELGPEDVVQCYFLQHAVQVERYSALVWNDAVTTQFPFASPRYLDTLLQVRTADRLEQRFQMAYLRGRAADLYNVPDANTGLHITAPAWRRKIHWFVEKVQVKLFQRKYLLEHGDFPAWMSNMQPTPETVLLDDLDDRCFDRQALGAVIEASKRSPKAGDIVEPLLMLELWRQRMGAGGKGVGGMG